MGYRSEYRAAARAALAAHPRTAEMEQMLAWASAVNAKRLPVLAVVTPQEQSEPSTHGSFERSTLLQVVVKRLGTDDIEDVLDDDAEAVELAVIAAIQTAAVQCLLEGITTTVNSDGETRVGTLIANFRVTSWRSLGP